MSQDRIALLRQVIDSLRFHSGPGWAGMAAACAEQLSHLADELVAEGAGHGDRGPALPLDPREWIALVAPVSATLKFHQDDEDKMWLVAVSGESVVWAKRREPEK